MSAVVLIGGPTATGKSALAVAIARRVGGVVINADSLQLYAGLPILTAQPTEAERALVPHELYAIFPPDGACDAASWAARAEAVATDALGRRQVPILVGGTGFYFAAFDRGLSPMPAVPEAVRTSVDAEVAADPVAAHRRLAAFDPVAARQIGATDRQRIVRALAVHAVSGRPLSAWQAEPRRPPLPELARVRIRLDPPRAALRDACDRRLGRMLAAGAIAEVAAAVAAGWPPTAPLRRALGFTAFAAVVAGALDTGTALARAQAQTRAYAKRQATWFHNQWADTIDVDAAPEQVAQEPECLADELVTKLRLG